MNNHQKITKEEKTLNLIRGDCLYANRNGELTPSALWQTFSKAFLDREFVSRLRRNDSQAFVINRFIGETRLGKETGLGPLTMEVMTLRAFKSPKEIDIAEESQLIDDEFCDLQLDGYSLMGNPLRPIGIIGPLEADLANILVQQVRVGLRSKRFLSRCDTRKREYQSQVTTTTRLIKRITQISPSVYTLRLDLYYRHDCLYRFDLVQTAKDLSSFLEQIEENPALPVVGYMWWREFLEEIGYRVHIVILCDTVGMPDYQQLTAHIGSIWFERVKGMGVYVDAALLTGSHRCHGIGYLAHPYVQSSLLDSLTWMNKREALIRLMPNNAVPHYGFKALVDLGETRAGLEDMNVSSTTNRIDVFPIIGATPVCHGATHVGFAS